MSCILLDEQTRMDMARQIADSAACLDWLKPVGAQEAEAVAHIDNLHNIARHLAGDRVDEIYASDDAFEMDEMQA